MKKLLLCLTLFMPLFGFSQTDKIDDVTFFNPNRDTLYIVNTELGKTILNVWIMDTTYKPVIIMIAGVEETGFWKTTSAKKPEVIVMVDAIVDRVHQQDKLSRSGR